MSLVAQALASLKEKGNYRGLASSLDLVDFSSNDYLGLARSEEIRARLVAALERGCALGSTGSRLLSGQTDEHAKVEHFLADTFRVESALVFSSGFMANLGVTSALAGLETHFFSDELNHASLVDGLRGTKKEIFFHNDIEHLEGLLKKSTSPVKAIVSESVFSMDGDFAPLDELLSLAKRFDAWLVIDEAHSTGVFGERGLGHLAEFGEGQFKKLISIHTGGKALGGQGAFVLSSLEFREWMINRSRSFIYSTALSPLSSLQMQFALEWILANPDAPRRLRERTKTFRSKLEAYSVDSHGAQIVPITLGSNERALSAAKELRARGFDIRAIRSPTVAPGKERLRITLKEFHNDSTMDQLVRALGEVL